MTTLDIVSLGAMQHFTEATAVTMRSNHCMVFSFANGYGGSVIDDGYGRAEGLLEAAVLKGGHLDYTTPITSDVVGWLTVAEAVAVLRRIRDLPPPTHRRLGQPGRGDAQEDT